MGLAATAPLDRPLGSFMGARPMVQRMCTLILLLHAVATHPLVLAMNRDERYGRPSAPPALLAGGRIVAPRDLQAGGTWIGVNASGVVIALSNRRVGSEDPGRRSRGLLVLDLLDSVTPAEAAARMEGELQARAYNPFNVVIADGGRAFYARWEGDGLAPSPAPLAPGVHALANGDMDDPSDPRVRRALALVASPVPAEIGGAKARLTAAVADHGGTGEGLCRHGREAGTVSSTFIALARGGHRESLLLHAPGPPGETPFQDFSQLLRGLTSAAGQGRPGR